MPCAWLKKRIHAWKAFHPKPCSPELDKRRLDNVVESYTPACIVRTLVEVLQPYSSRVYDFCCGSGGMFVQSYQVYQWTPGKHKQHLCTRTRQQPYHMENGTNELSHSRYRNRYFLRLPTPYPQSRLHPDNPPFNLSDREADKLQGYVR